ncbi:MAG: hypothetical protein Q9163_006547 [Psora crenata]
MEGDAKGQVGGMEMPQAERERLADESRQWRCAGCGARTNEDILREEGGERAEQGNEEQIIPKDLQLGFRDQMGGTPDGKIDKGKGKEAAVSPPLPTCETSPASGAQQPNSAPSTAVPRRSPSTINNMAPNAPALPTMAPRTSTDGVPAWVDKAITGVMAALAVMIIKKILV